MGTPCEQNNGQTHIKILPSCNILVYIQNTGTDNNQNKKHISVKFHMNSANLTNLINSKVGNIVSVLLNYELCINLKAFNVS